MSHHAIDPRLCTEKALKGRRRLNDKAHRRMSPLELW
jgi:hypothetical protein